jgi:DNA-binding NtrC family response regulator
MYAEIANPWLGPAAKLFHHEQFQGALEASASQGPTNCRGSHVPSFWCAILVDSPERRFYNRRPLDVHNCGARARDGSGELLLRWCSMSGTSTVLLVAPDDPTRQAVQALATESSVQMAESSSSALSRFFEHKHPVLVLIGPNIPRPWDALRLVRVVRQWSPRVPVAIVTSKGTEEFAVAALRAGVNDYFKTPLLIDDFIRGVRRLLTDSDKSDAVDPAPVTETPFQAEHLIGTSRAASSIRASIQRLATTDSNALITGETGTGKELAARLIHAGSRRSGRAFVSINCAAIPEMLVESELFGYERGAFTGAATSNVGRVLAAHRGTAFFDEIGDLSPTAQAKVLRLVEEKEVNRLGTTRHVQADVRIVTATNRNLEALVTEGGFRNDLYFRLNVARLRLPALRERREDIPLLLAHYLRVIGQRLRRNVEAFTSGAVEVLTRYDWPGNIREVKNLVERLIINASSRVIDVADLPEEVLHGACETEDSSSDRTRLLSALSSAHGNKSAAARALGWSRMTLYRKLIKHHIPQERSYAASR